jgi:hypothetical protein
MKITVHIERLVLDGLPILPHQGAHLGRALEARLSSLLKAGVPPHGLTSSESLPGIPAAAIQLARDASPVQLGGQIAQAVYGAMSPNAGEPAGSSNHRR